MPVLGLMWIFVFFLSSCSTVSSVSAVVSASEICSLTSGLGISCSVKCSGVKSFASASISAFLRHAQALCDGGNRLGVPVAQEKGAALFPGQRREKDVDRLLQRTGLRRLLRGLSAGDALAQVLEHEVELPSPALLRLAALQHRERDAARELAEKRGEHGWPVRRDGVPRVEPGVVDRLLRILLAEEDAEGDGVAIDPVGLRRRRNGARVALPIELHDLGILHRRPLLSPIYTDF